MESQSFVFMKLRWEVQEPTTNKELFMPLVRYIVDVSLIAINRILLTEPEQVGFSMASRKINYPLHNSDQNLISLFQLLQVFFKSLPPPVCLVAHNGGNFDFPILNSELKRVLKDCPDIGGTFDNVFCVDSADGFFKLLTPSPCVSDVDKASKQLFDDGDLENVKPNASSLVMCDDWNNTSLDQELTVILDITSKFFKKRNFDRFKVESIVQAEYNYLTKFGDRKATKEAGRRDESDAKNMKHSKEKTPLRRQIESRQTVDLSLESIFKIFWGESVTICGIEGEVEALAEIVAQLGIPIIEIFDRIKAPFLSKAFV